MNDTEHSGTGKREEDTLHTWKEKYIFEKTLEGTDGKDPFVFYDGPPFATGLPHYGHILAGTIKDAIPRYKTMRGNFVRREWGWDCHGLPLENIIEEELGLGGHKKDIEKYGIEKFNEAARAAVVRYEKDWREIIPRTGRFVDMSHPYRTMDTSYTESVWWAFKTLHDKGMLYEGYKSMHLCPRCETTLSNFEVSQGYKDVTDISVYVKFELVDEPGTFFLAWTTTPWTLPGNAALAVNPESEYIKVEIQGEKGKETLIFEKELYEKKIKDKGAQGEIVRTYKGKELIGKAYIPLFDFYSKNKELENVENGWKIYGADFVTTEDGTGIVHIAPAFGEDDMALGKKEKLPFIQHVKGDGIFTKETKEFAGREAKPKEDPQATDVEIIKYLAKKNLLFAKEKIIHSYPHCWRCKTPLLNYASRSWFVRVSEMRDKLVSENKKIQWVPDSIGSARFGNWLENARDWSISRARFWGAPIPVWRCESCDETKILGSFEELRAYIQTSGNRYFVMRHAEAESNIKRFVQSDVKNTTNMLTEKGREQAKKTGEKLVSEKIDLIISSDLLRTKETADIVRKTLGLPEESIVYDPRLREWQAGILDGKSMEEIDEMPGKKETFSIAPEKGESYADIKKRVAHLLYEIEKTYLGKTILFVTHGSPAWLLSAVGLGKDEEGAVNMFKEGFSGFRNAEVRPLTFVPVPHTDTYEFDVHKPYIDHTLLSCSCGGSMRRIPDVFDCWFESGSMPYGQFHYPFENEKEFKNNFPADFIAEGVDQTRGWFYSMLVLGVALFGKAPYKNVVVNGTVLAADGQKMSKSLKNYPDPLVIINKYGADALRYYLLSSPVVRGEDLSFSEKSVDEIHKKIILRLENTLSFYELYKGEVPPSPANTSENILDQWIISRLSLFVSETEKGFESYELDRAARPLLSFVDDFSTWYVRRSRERFKEEGRDKDNALATIRFVFLALSKAIAPIMPFFAETLYLRAGGEKESVHLESWPRKEAINENLLLSMESARKIVEMGMALRVSAGNIKVRQPLGELSYEVLDGTKALTQTLEEIVADELNVKKVAMKKGLTNREGAQGKVSLESNGIFVSLDTTLTEELIQEGVFRELLRAVQDARKTKDFSPHDDARVSIEANDEGKKVLALFSEDLKKTARIVSLKEESVSEGEEVSFAGFYFKFSISR